MRNQQNLGLIFILILAIGVLLYFLFKKETEIIEVPVKVEVPVPVIEKQFDTIEVPTPIYIAGKKEIDSAYYKEYLKLKDSVRRDSMFRDAITLRQYSETYEDSIQTIKVYSEVQGLLKRQTVNYVTKPRTVTLDTTLQVPIKKRKFQLGVGAELGIPTQTDIMLGSEFDDVIVKGNFSIHTQKSVFNISYDTQKRIWAGYTIKF